MTTVNRVAYILGRGPRDFGALPKNASLFIVAHDDTRAENRAQVVIRVTPAPQALRGVLRQFQMLIPNAMGCRLMRERMLLANLSILGNAPNVVEGTQTEVVRSNDEERMMAQTVECKHRSLGFRRIDQRVLSGLELMR